MHPAALFAPHLFKLIAIDVIPTTVFLNKTAQFMHAFGTSAETVSRNEFDDSAMFTSGLVSPDIQMYPLWGRGVGNQSVGGARIGMPGGHQVVAQLKDVGAVARSHQRFGIGGIDAGMKALAAFGVAAGRITGAGRVVDFHGGE